MPIPQLSKKTKSPQDWRKNNIRSYSTSASSARNKTQGSYKSSPLGSPRRRRPKLRRKKTKYSKTAVSNLVFLFLIAILAAAIIGMLYLAWLSRDLPDPNKLIDRDVPESTKIFDRTGETILYEIHGDEKRTIIKLEEIPDYMKWATITAEDRTFYEHHGFNLLAMLKGVVIDPLIGRRMRGGSTLTQQLVKNAILTSERKVSRKIREFVLSYRIEKKFSKDEILQLYFNEIPYGSNAYGIEAAARKYFGLSAKDINLAQAAILASLPKAPTYYSPHGSNKDKLIARQKYVLEEMEKLGHITQDELEDALTYELKFREPNTDIIAPHFVMYVRELLSAKYGDQVIEREGLKIYTTLDLDKQEIAEEVIVERGEKNEKEYNASNAALVSIDPKTGQILAMVGSRDYFNEDIDGQVNVAVRLRQPGSSLKPIVYAIAFQGGFTPDTILYDVVTNFAADGKDYEPHNYDLEERGPVTMRTALAGSLNIPGVKTLYLAGVHNVIEQAQKMGYTSLNEPDRYGLSLVLGGGEVKLLEHTAAYGAFAREGEYYQPVAILKIEDRKGKILEEYEPEKKIVMPVEITRLINDILSDNEARTFAFGANNWLTLSGRPIAAKTGTTNDYRDAWTIGYTPSLVTGVWVGNNDNSEMKRGAAGGKVAAPIWNNYMRRVLADTPVEYFAEIEKEETGKPALDGIGAGEIKIKIDIVSGLLATEDTPEEVIEEKAFKQPHSILYYANKDDPRGESPGEDQQDPQFQIWEEAIMKWAEKEEIELDEVPTEYDDIHKPEYIPEVKISRPRDNAVITNKTLIVDITVTSNGPFEIDRSEYYIDNHLISRVERYPYDLSSDINFLNNGNHELVVRVCDSKENCWRGSQQFNLVLDESERDTSLGLVWMSPSNNVSFSSDQFPLQMKTLTYRPQVIKEVNFYYLKNGDLTPQLIMTNQNIVDNEIIGFWQEAPEPGVYHIYAEGIGWPASAGWSGNFVLTKQVKINVKE